MQHASSTIPNYAEGYCTDDNARALALAMILKRSGQGSARLSHRATTYAAFLHHALIQNPGASTIS